MDNKLELLLNKINLEKNNFKFFENGKIIKIISSKDKLNWNFIIDVKELLPIEILEKFDNNLKDVKVETYAYRDEFIPHGSVEELEKFLTINIKSGKI